MIESLMDMKQKLLIILGLLPFVGLLFFLQNQQSQSSPEVSKEKKASVYKVVKQDDLLLMGDVQSDNITILDNIATDQLLIKNGEPVAKNQKISKNGYEAPVAGMFSIGEDGTLSIISQWLYVASSVSELDRELISEEQALQAKVLETGKIVEAKISWINRQPTITEKTLSYYAFKAEVADLRIGQHVLLTVPYKTVVIPEQYLKDNQLLVKLPEEKGWRSLPIDLFNKGGVLYANLSDIPIGTMLKEQIND